MNSDSHLFILIKLLDHRDIFKNEDYIYYITL